MFLALPALSLLEHFSCLIIVFIKFICLGFYTVKAARYLFFSALCPQHLAQYLTRESASYSVMSNSSWHHDCIAKQAPLSMEFSRQEYWSGLPFSFPGDLPDPGVELKPPTFQADSLPSEPPGKPILISFAWWDSLHVVMLQGHATDNFFLIWMRILSWIKKGLGLYFWFLFH